MVNLNFNARREKRFHNRERNSTAFCVIHQMSIKHRTQIINPFLNSMISANHVKGEEFQLIVKSFYR